MKPDAAEIERRREHVRTVVEGLHGNITAYFRKRRVVVAELPADLGINGINSLRASGYACEQIAHTMGHQQRCLSTIEGVIAYRYDPSLPAVPVSMAVFEINLSATPPAPRPAPSAAEITRPRPRSP